MSLAPLNFLKNFQVIFATTHFFLEVAKLGGFFRRHFSESVFIFRRVGFLLE